MFIDQSKPYTNKNNQKKNHGAYITYEQDFSAGLALLAIDRYQFENDVIKASFGMTKYCKYFLQGKVCKW